MQVDAHLPQPGPADDLDAAKQRLQALQAARDSAAKASKATSAIATAMDADVAASVDLLKKLQAHSSSIACGLEAVSAASALCSAERLRTQECHAAGAALAAKRAALSAAQAALERAEQRCSRATGASSEGGGSDRSELLSQVRAAKADVAAVQATHDAATDTLAGAREATGRGEAAWARAQDDIGFESAAVDAADRTAAQRSLACQCARAIADAEKRHSGAAAALREAERSGAEVRFWYFCVCTSHALERHVRVDMRSNLAGASHSHLP